MVRTFEELLRTNGINGDERLICYEDSLRGMYGASCRAWYLLNTLGHPNVQVLEGGWQKWLRDGLPVVSGPPREEPARGTFTASFNDAAWVSLEDVKAVVNRTADAKLLDVRDRVEWDGSSSSPYGIDFAPRKGRLPGAQWIEWYDFMKECKEAPDEEPDESDDEDWEMPDVVEFKNPVEIRKLMGTKGFTPKDKIVLYCFKGARASNTLSALKLAGFKNVSIYFASWNEWSRQKDLAIDEVKF